MFVFCGFCVVCVIFPSSHREKRDIAIEVAFEKLEEEEEEKDDDDKMQKSELCENFILFKNHNL
jgi:hypothetical protein